MRGQMIKNQKNQREIASEDQEKWFPETLDELFVVFIRCNVIYCYS